MAAGAASAGSAGTTPLMRQYLTIKGQHTDAILFFRMGDFYEMFFEDAEIAARELDITLTARDKNAGEKVPLAGFPHHQLKPYVNKLLERGYKVAICDQTEDPKESRKAGKAIVERAVTRVLTPGLVVDEDALEARAPSWLAAASRDGGKIGLAFLDISTGELLVTECANDEEAWSEILRIAPKELLLTHVHGDARKSDDPFAVRAAKHHPAAMPVTPRPPREFEPAKAAGVVKEQLGVVTLDGQGLTGMDAGVGAAGAAIAYARENARAALVHVRRAQPYRRTEAVLLDESTRRNLEVFEATTGGRKGSLLDVIDGTVTSMGGRTVRSWLSAPLLSVSGIRGRLDAVGALVSSPLARAEIRTELGHVADLPRIVGRVATGVATPRDLKGLRDSLLRLPALQYVVGGIPGVVTRRPDGTQEPAGRLTDVHAGIDPCEKLAEDLATTLADDPPVKLSDGGVIRAGADKELDEINALATDAKGFIAALETRERERTGIGSLKVRFNRVFGYYIEITTSHLGKVPKDYLRKQTTAGGERFYTPELKTFEEKVLTAEESRLSIEAKLFESLRARVAAQAERLLATAGAIAELDALTGFAERASIHGWVKPFVDDADVLDIEAGRHPVIEGMNLGERFVPNDVRLDDESRLLILTGPNMAGKSTVMRQLALIVLMAQTGCFAPAKRAHVGVVDRVFTRVGASDLLSRGQSTFMVEMSETANILNNATPKSLVIIDEIGRGTSTFDGVSIAWAVAEYLHDITKAKTLFATHYHELTALSQTKLKAKNFHIAVKEWNDQIIFLRKLVEGATSRSYGIQVARLAGLPDSVLGRAREVLTEMTGTSPAPRLPQEAATAAAGQMSLFGNPAADAVLAELRALETDAMTPLEALQTLARLKAKA